jgi:hypothetical protein
MPDGGEAGGLAGRGRMPVAANLAAFIGYDGYSQAGSGHLNLVVEIQ